MTQYPLLENINQELAKTPELSNHNKKILEKFFQKYSESGTGMFTQKITQAGLMPSLSISNLNLIIFDDQDKVDRIRDEIPNILN